MTAVQTMASPNGGSSGANGPDEAGTVRSRQGTPDVFPLLPLRGLVAFPHSSYPIFLGRPKSIKAATHAYEHTIPVLLVTQRDQGLNAPTSSDMYEVGTIAAVVEKLSLPDGTMKSVIEGIGRVWVRHFIFNEEFFKAEAEPTEEPTTSDARRESVTGLVLSAFLRERLRTTSRGKNQPKAFGVAAARASGAAILADTIASESRIDLASKQTLREILDPLERLQKLLAYLTNSQRESKIKSAPASSTGSRNSSAASSTL
jgi:ATP-dependent Lon protease